MTNIATVLTKLEPYVHSVTPARFKDQMGIEYRPRTSPVTIQLWLGEENPEQIECLTLYNDRFEIQLVNSIVKIFDLNLPFEDIIKAYVVDLKHVATI